MSIIDYWNLGMLSQSILVLMVNLYVFSKCTSIHENCIATKTQPLSSCFLI